MSIRVGGYEKCMEQIDAQKTKRVNQKGLKSEKSYVQERTEGGFQRLQETPLDFTQCLKH